MFVIDVSGSMGKLASGGYAENEDDFKDAPISKLVTSVNQAIDQLLTASPNSRFGIVIYGSTAAVLVPLGHITSGTPTGFSQRALSVSTTSKACITQSTPP